MLTVIGGTYREVCLEPSWDQLFGSGFRAAAAVAKIILDARSEAVALVTWVSDSELAELRLRAGSLGITLDARSRNDGIEFQYEHGLSVPKILPPPQRIVRIEPYSLDLADGTALVFGLMEDRVPGAADQLVTITARTVIYDPQSASRSLPWSKTGSSCTRLAIVSNLVEAVAMAEHLGIDHDRKCIKPVAIAQSLLESEGAEVVIVKCGAEGAFVVTRDDVHHICSYKPKWLSKGGAFTDSLFPIGTGDVFSGVFAAYWGAMLADPVEAAQRASAAAAYHSAFNPTSIPPNSTAVLEQLIPHSTVSSRTKSTRPRVYIAGPLFNFQQRWFIEEVRRCLEEHGVNPFSPFHEVGILGDDNQPEEIYRKDIAGLEECSAVFAVVDGLDAGTLFEIGYAVAKNIPVIAFRQCTPDQELTMVLGSPVCQVHSDFPTAVFQAAWTALEL